MNRSTREIQAMTAAMEGVKQQPDVDKLIWRSRAKRNGASGREHAVGVAPGIQRNTFACRCQLETDEQFRRDHHLSPTAARDHQRAIAVGCEQSQDRIDGLCARFIAASPFVFIASRSAGGAVDLSPKGDPPGFVQVLDDRTLAIPDRLGNNRVDTLCNLIEDDRIGAIFLVPGKSETLRISGRGAIVRDAKLNHRLAHKARPPNLAIVIEVERAGEAIKSTQQRYVLEAGGPEAIQKIVLFRPRALA